jgi:hypothetical protein
MPPEKNDPTVKTPAKILQGPTPKKVDLNAPAVVKAEVAAPMLDVIGLPDDQLAAVLKAIVISGAINGMLASGRHLGSVENLRILDQAIKVGLGGLERL